MTASEYWDGDSLLPIHYRKAHKMKQENANHVAWLHGLYVYDALVSALSHLNKNKKDHKDFAHKPYSFSSEQREEEKEEKVAEAQAQAEVWMKAWVTATQKQFKEK